MNNLNRQTDRQTRIISIEILRLLAMFMIVLGHAFGHGHAMEQYNGPIADALVSLVKTCTVPGTDIFVLISGYFLINSRPSVKRVVSVWLQVFFYSIGIYGVLAATGMEKFSVGALIKYSMPMAFNSYWFMRVYFYLILCVPFLNVLLNALDENGHRLLLWLGVFLMVIPASIPGISTFNKESGNGILWFMMLYATGAYFSKYPPRKKIGVYCITAALMIFLAWISKIAIKYVSNRLGFGGMGASRFSVFDAFPIYVFSVCLLCIAVCFSKREKWNAANKTVNKTVLFFSKSTAGIYMIHEHPVVRQLLWGTLKLQGGNLRYVVAVSVLIFIVAAVLDNVTWRRLAKIVGRINTSKIDRNLFGIY